MTNFRLELRCLLSLAVIHAVAGNHKDVDVERDTLRGLNTAPLTEIFTAPASCLTEILTMTEDQNPSLEVGCRTAGKSGNECCPPSWSSNRYFSPGVCPKDYQACTLPTTAQREETTNLCCPSGFDCPTDARYDQCYSFINSDVTITYEVNSKTYTGAYSRVTASPIQIRFKATDSDVVPIPTASFDLPVEVIHHPLSRQVKGWIAFGSVMGFIIIAFLSWGFYSRRKAKKAGQPVGSLITRYPWRNDD
ncbi:uncharacterized protein DNG_04334 [Cephalotrichum gorgonifer]|uniref:Uncharacterized protein n=1 Tax=Cephalotrichum gorgonifer TaxID=2041049 RepID=A0AAE8MVV4_9PEZI|nr:uncharacterized protein DNG_04334 [Cephalotrichum gorgonifer]